MHVPDDLLMKLELKISCTDLTPEENSPPPRPYVLIKIKDENGKFNEIGRTDIQQDEKNPIFVETLDIDYHFDEIQTLKFVAFAKDDDEATADDNGLGFVDITLGQIVSAGKITTKLISQNPISTAAITISATETTNINEIEFVIHGTGLVKKDFLGKSHPYLVVRKQRNGEFSTIYKTEKIKDTRKPQWVPFSVRMQRLCEDDPNQLISFQVYDHDNDGPHYLIGECEAPLSRLILQQNFSTTLDLINHKKKMKKKDYKNSGKLSFVQCKIVKKYSFLDYIFGGCKLGFECGIDFTGSNGDPRLSSSLHYTGSVNPNSYVQSFQALGNVLQDYQRKDGCHKVYGFGAKIPPKDEVSHIFPLDLDNENPCFADTQRFFKTYTETLEKIKLWGPTNVAPIINQVSTSAKEFQSASNYVILLLIIDGVITDVNDTREAIVASSDLPVSIIIIGVGNADFSAMRLLTGDQLQVSSVSGRKAIRNNVQFLLFRNYKMLPSAAFGKIVLSSIPNQMLEYFSIKNLAPTSGEP